MEWRRGRERGADVGRQPAPGQGTITESYTYDGFGQVTRHTTKAGATTLLELQYTYDALGRITRMVETVQGATRTVDYGYDTAGRLATVDVDSTRVATYTYDSNGNRSGGTYDARDRMTAYGSATYTYRASGELASRTDGSDVTDHAYDERGSLRGVTLPDATQIDYVIDALGRRVGKDVDGAAMQGFLYADTLSPVAELDGSDAVISTFVYASRDDLPDAMIMGGTTYRILSDHLGSPRLVVNASTGAVAQRLDYDAFGVVTTDTNPGFQPFGFAGGLYDADTGLLRFGVRDYDPASGRFTARDPILFAGGQANLYEYVGGDPVNRVDPRGTGPGRRRRSLSSRDGSSREEMMVLAESRQRILEETRAMQERLMEEVRANPPSRGPSRPALRWSSIMDDAHPAPPGFHRRRSDELRTMIDLQRQMRESIKQIEATAGHARSLESLHAPANRYNGLLRD